MPDIVKIPGFTREIGKPKNWDEATQGPCASLPVRDVIVDGQPFMLSAWKPTAAELELLNKGLGIYLGVSGFNSPVLFMGIGDAPDYEENKLLKAVIASGGATFSDDEEFTIKVPLPPVAPRSDMPTSFTWRPNAHQRGAALKNTGKTLEDLNAGEGVSWQQLAAILEARSDRYMPVMQALMVCLRIQPQPGFTI